MITQSSKDQSMQFNQANPKLNAQILWQLIYDTMHETNIGVMLSTANYSVASVRLKTSHPLVMKAKTFIDCTVRLDGIPSLEIKVTHNPNGNFTKFINHHVYVSLYENNLVEVIVQKITDMVNYVEEAFLQYELSWKVQESQVLKNFLEFLNVLKGNIYRANSNHVSTTPVVKDYTMPPLTKEVIATWEGFRQLTLELNPNLKHAHFIDLENGRGEYINYHSDWVEGTYGYADNITFAASLDKPGKIEVTIQVGNPSNIAIATMKPKIYTIDVDKLYTLVPVINGHIATQKARTDRVHSLDMLEYVADLLPKLSKMYSDTGIAITLVKSLNLIDWVDDVSINSSNTNIVEWTFNDKPYSLDVTDEQAYYSLFAPHVVINNRNASYAKLNCALIDALLLLRNTK